MSTRLLSLSITARPQSQSAIEDLEYNEALIKTDNVFSSATESTNHNHEDHEETLSFTYSSGYSCIPATYQQNNEQNAAKSEGHSLQNDYHQLIKKAFDAHALRPNDMVISNTSVLENVRYNCDKYEKSFTLKTSLYAHNKSAHEYLRYHCNKCGTGFPWWGDLSTHIKSVHDNLRCNCDKCEESFYQNFILNEHIPFTLKTSNLHIKRVHQKVRHPEPYS